MDKGAFGEWKAAWPLPFIAALGIAMFNLPAHSLGMFFAPLEAELGWSRAQSASGLLAMSGVAIFTVPLLGRLVDVKGARRIALPGVLLFALAFAALALPRSPTWAWWGAWMVLGVAAAWISPVVWTAAVASRFDKGRGLAIAVSLSGAGFGTIVAPLLANWLITGYGWRTAYAAMGAIFCIILLPLVFFLFYGANDAGRRAAPSQQREPAVNSPKISIREIFANRQFMRLAAATFLVALSLLALVVHFVPILVAAGVEAPRAAEAAAFVGAGSIIGRIVAGLLLDRIHGTIVGSVAFSLPVVVAVALMSWGGGPQMMFAIAFLLGFSLGSEIDVVAYLTSRYVGMANFGSYFGVSVSALALATGAGPFLAGLLYDLSGSYDLLLMSVIPLCLAAAGLVLTLGAYREDAPIHADDPQEPSWPEPRATS